jgi:hypothetical protein
MSKRWNDLQWDGRPGHYEVYYLTFTDPATGVGFWIRYTMVAPLSEAHPEAGEEATCSLWLCAMDPADPSQNVGVKSSLPVDSLTAEADPVQVRVGEAWLSDNGMAGSIESAGTSYGWELEWSPRLEAYGHVHPLLRATKIAKTILFLPHPDLGVSGTVRLGDRRIELSGARGGQAHLWGSKHASRWSWVHCNDFTARDGAPRPDTFVDGVSVFVPRFGRELGPSTPVVGRVDGVDLNSISPLAVSRNPSEFDLEGWRFEATANGVRVKGTVSARPEDLVGVTYHDPDGQLAYCYNTEVADMRLEVLRRERGGWKQVEELRAGGRAHFEYAQRTPIDGVELKIA